VRCSQANATSGCRIARRRKCRCRMNGSTTNRVWPRRSIAAAQPECRAAMPIRKVATGTPPPRFLAGADALSRCLADALENASAPGLLANTGCSFRVEEDRSTPSGRIDRADRMAEMRRSTRNSLQSEQLSLMRSRLITALAAAGVAAYLFLNFGFPMIGCNVKGNIGARGERIYHLPGQEYYSRTVINWFQGERWFCSEDAARAAGWRKAGR